MTGIKKTNKKREDQNEETNPEKTKQNKYTTHNFK